MVRAGTAGWPSVIGYILCLICLALAKELPLPPCEDIPWILCGEGRIRNFCQNRCGRAGLEAKGNRIRNDRTTTAPWWPTQKWTVTSIRPWDTTTITNWLGAKPVAVNETARQNFLAPVPPEKLTLPPGLEEEVEEFFNPTTQRPQFLALTTTRPQVRVCDKIQPCVELAEANRRFLEKCQTSVPPMAPNCFGFCRYDVVLNDLKNAFVRGTCPISQTRLYLNAASGFNDNSFCCSATGVFSGRRRICTPFCYPNGQFWPDKRDSFKYLPCLQSFEQIMRCHWAGLV